MGGLIGVAIAYADPDRAVLWIAVTAPVGATFACAGTHEHAVPAPAAATGTLLALDEGSLRIGVPLVIRRSDEASTSIAILGGRF